MLVILRHQYMLHLGYEYWGINSLSKLGPELSEEQHFSMDM